MVEAEDDELNGSDCHVSSPSFRGSCSMDGRNGAWKRHRPIWMSAASLKPARAAPSTRPARLETWRFGRSRSTASRSGTASPEREARSCSCTGSRGPGGGGHRSSAAWEGSAGCISSSCRGSAAASGPGAWHRGSAAGWTPSGSARSTFSGIPWAVSSRRRSRCADTHRFAGSCSRPRQVSPADEGCSAGRCRCSKRSTACAAGCRRSSRTPFARGRPGSPTAWRTRGNATFAPSSETSARRRYSSGASATGSYPRRSPKSGSGFFPTRGS